MAEYTSAGRENHKSDERRPKLPNSFSGAAKESSGITEETRKYGAK
jgi:hypothetical protein